MRATDSHPYSLQQGIELRTSSPEEIETARLHHLQNHLAHAQNVPYYQDLFQKYSFNPQDMGTTHDLCKLPLMGRDDLESAGDSLYAKSVSIRDISHTSGTTGDPVIVPYTEKDLQRLAYNEAIAFYGAGIRPEDRVLLTVTLDRCFIAGLAYYSGVTFLGAQAIRSGPGNPSQQWLLIDKLKPSVLLGVPTFLLTLAGWGEENGYAPKASTIHTLITIGEPIRKGNLELTSLGAKLQEMWAAPALSSYGATEVETAFGDCRFGSGSHVHPELMILEIVDENGNILPDDTPGEVVVTPLGVEGLPLIRFKTGDIARKHTSPCPCGWNTERIGPIEGRISQRLKYKGTTIYPEMIYQALQEINQVEDYYIEVTSTYDLADDITVFIGGDSCEIDTKAVAGKLQGHLRAKPNITLSSRDEVIRKTGKGVLRKPKKFFDLREKIQS